MGLRELFRAMADFFIREKMAFAVIGAFGLQAFGYVRATRDIDFITRREYREKIIRHLESLGFDTIQKTDAFSNHVHPLGNARIDLMYVEHSTADTIFSSVQKAVFFENTELPVVSPEHLIALKLFAAHNEPKRKLRELSDIQDILRRVTVDRTVVKKCFETYGFKEKYEEIASEDTQG